MNFPYFFIIALSVRGQSRPGSAIICSNLFQLMCCGNFFLFSVRTKSLFVCEKKRGGVAKPDAINKFTFKR